MGPNDYFCHMDASLQYTAEDFSTTLPTADYIARFRDAERFIAYCRACRNFGHSWGCPPFDYDMEQLLRSHDTALLVATKITPTESGRPLSDAGALIRPERTRIEGRLLEMEHLYGGRSFAYVGTCLYCPEGCCTRPEGRPCRHPDRVRPSLEAYGFDIGKTASELFGIELRWSTDGRLPEYLTLVCGFFHNAQHVRWMNGSPR